MFVGGGTPSLLGGDGLGVGARRDPRPLRPGRRRRGHHRGQPGVDVAAVVRRPARRRVHPDLAGHAVGGAARAGGAGPGALAGTAAAAPPPRPAPPGSTTSTSTSSTARRGRPTTTCAARSTPRSRPASTTCPPTRWSSRTAPRWPDGCAAVRSPRPTTTCSRSATNCSTRGCPTRASTGTRCRTGAVPAGSAGTTSATGTAASGGAPGPARTATSARTRWWNVKHPNAYAESLADGALPVADFEELDDADRHTEDVMLRLRLRHGSAGGAAQCRRGRSRRRRGRRRTGRAARRAAGADRPRPAARRRSRARPARGTSL